MFLLNLCLTNFFQIMRKFSFLVVACAIAMFTAVMSSCDRKPAAPEIPEGTAIGNVKYFIGEDSLVKFIQVKDDGTKVAIDTEYSNLELDSAGFIVATVGEKFELLKLDGKFFAFAESYKAMPYFTISSDEVQSYMVLTKVPVNGNHLAFDVKTGECLINIEGIKEEVLPISNGITLFKKGGLWGIAEAQKEEAICEDLQAVAVVSVKAKATYYWVQAKAFTGLIDKKGQVVKPLGAAALKALKKKGKLLWENEDKTIFGVEVNRI